MSAKSIQKRSELTHLRNEILGYLNRSEDDTDFCGRCHLPFPVDDYEEYEFCPWCDQSICGYRPREAESRRIIEHQREVHVDIQCGECGCEYGQPIRYPFSFCPHCGAKFAAEDELLIELPFEI